MNSEIATDGLMVKFPLRTALIAGLCLVSTGLSAIGGPSIVVDIGSGKVLSQEDADRRWYPASLTKLMTVYVTFRAVALEELALSSPVEISKNALSEPPSKMAYPVGTVLSVDNAVKILMVKSANDIATALGETVGGSERLFAERMNKEAARLGMTGSHFVNAHGLHDDAQYTTAHDLAVLVSALRGEFPQYADYFKIEAIAAGKNVMPNHNDLIGRFEGADGMKTGYTCPAGFNVVATANRGGREVMAVVLGAVSPDARAYRTAELLTQGFAKSDAAAPRLADLTPTGAAIEIPGNMREQICTEEAQKRIAKTRDEKGKPLVPSPFLTEMTRQPVVVSIALGAKGPKPKQPRYADVPTPTPRPDYAPGTAALAGAEQGG